MATVAARQSLCRMLGTELPIVQAPMAGVQLGALAHAVSNAGGLGSLPCAMLTVEAMRAELAAIRAVTDKPFNVNFFCHAPPIPSPQREAAWRKLLAPYFEEHGIDASSVAAGPGRAPFSAEAADALDEFAPRVVSFHFGLPSAHAIHALHDVGILLLATATNLAEARRIAAAGVDAIIAQGWEAGGHRGMFDPDAPDDELSTIALTRLLVRATEIPVIAAGGIMDGAGISAVLQLGASAAQLGTAFIACADAGNQRLPVRCDRTDRSGGCTL